MANTADIKRRAADRASLRAQAGRAAPTGLSRCRARIPGIPPRNPAAIRGGRRSSADAFFEGGQGTIG